MKRTIFAIILWLTQLAPPVPTLAQQPPSKPELPRVSVEDGRNLQSLFQKPQQCLPCGAEFEERGGGL
jgi:hypothetical protein